MKKAKLLLLSSLLFSLVLLSSFLSTRIQAATPLRLIFAQLAREYAPVHNIGYVWYNNDYDHSPTSTITSIEPAYHGVYPDVERAEYTGYLDWDDPSNPYPKGTIMYWKPVVETLGLVCWDSFPLTVDNSDKFALHFDPNYVLGSKGYDVGKTIPENSVVYLAPHWRQLRRHPAAEVCISRVEVPPCGPVTLHGYVVNNTPLDTPVRSLSFAINGEIYTIDPMLVPGFQFYMDPNRIASFSLTLDLEDGEYTISHLIADMESSSEVFTNRNEKYMAHVQDDSLTHFTVERPGSLLRIDKKVLPRDEGSAPVSSRTVYPGEVVTYVYRVTNRSEEDLTDILISDSESLFDGVLKPTEVSIMPSMVSSLPAGESCTFTGTYTVPASSDIGSETPLECIRSTSFVTGKRASNETIQKSRWDCDNMVVSLLLEEPEDPDVPEPPIPGDPIDPENPTDPEVPVDPENPEPPVQTPAPVIPLPKQTVAYDLALQYWVHSIDGRLTGQNGTELHPETKEVFHGNQVQYSIRVLNQGSMPTIPAKLISQMSAGMSFDPKENPGWTLRSDGRLEYTTRQVIPGGESLLCSLTLRVTQNEDAPLISHVRIAQMTDGNAMVVEDVDSPVGESMDVPVQDNVVHENGKAGGDMDNHDIALVMCKTEKKTGYDLALQHWIHSVDSALTGQTGTEAQPPVVEVSSAKSIAYHIRVINQGIHETIPSRIVYKIPEGLSFDQQKNTDWKHRSDGLLELNPKDILKPGAKVTYMLRLDVKTDSQTVFSTDARIAEIMDIHHRIVEDMDSPCEESMYVAVKDNCIDENGRENGDMDNHDIAVIRIGLFEDMSKTGIPFPTPVVAGGVFMLLLSFVSIVVYRKRKMMN